MNFLLHLLVLSAGASTAEMSPEKNNKKADRRERCGQHDEGHQYLSGQPIDISYLD
jgi:hypothetical protein